MIYLKELFDGLAYGKFANMAVGNSASGSIKQEQYPRVVYLINNGLLDIYTRLVLKKKEFDLYQRTGKSIYYLRPDNVGNVNSGDPDVYIDGTVDDPIDSDIIKLLQAFDSDGEEVYINNKRYPDDIFLPEPDIIKIEPRDPLEVISCVYQASYPKIVIESGFDPATYKLNFPIFIQSALLAKVASEWFVGKASTAAEGQPTLNTTFVYEYEKEIAKIFNKQLVPEEDEEPEQFEDNGWA